MIFIFIRELFYTTAAALAVFGAMETIRPGMVLAYIDINLVLLFWLILGIFIITFFSGREADDFREKRNDERKIH